jgi:hypothetical protein
MGIYKSLLMDYEEDYLSNLEEGQDFLEFEEWLSLTHPSPIQKDTNNAKGEKS